MASNVITISAYCMDKHGADHVIQTTRTETVKNVKVKIRNDCYLIDPMLLDLYFGKTKLNDDQQIGEYGIGDGARLTLRFLDGSGDVSFEEPSPEPTPTQTSVVNPLGKATMLPEESEGAESKGSSDQGK